MLAVPLSILASTLICQIETERPHGGFFEIQPRSAADSRMILAARGGAQGNHVNVICGMDSDLLKKLRCKDFDDALCEDERVCKENIGLRNISYPYFSEHFAAAA